MKIPMPLSISSPHVFLLKFEASGFLKGFANMMTRQSPLFASQKSHRHYPTTRSYSRILGPSRAWKSPKKNNAMTQKTDLGCEAQATFCSRIELLASWQTDTCSKSWLLRLSSLAANQRARMDVGLSWKCISA
jgi:hypothetical protein